MFCFCSYISIYRVEADLKHNPRSFYKFVRKNRSFSSILKTSSADAANQIIFRFITISVLFKYLTGHSV